MIWILWYWLEWKSTYTFLTTKKWISPDKILILDEKQDIDAPKWVALALGKKCYDTLIECDVIRRSPGITNHLIRSKLTKPSDFEIMYPRLTSQTQYFLDHYYGFVIWVTWTKGKSMTSTALYHTLDYAWLDIKLVWNIGIPVLDLVDLDAPPEYVVYEISSFMLESLWDVSFDIGIFTSLYSTHTAEHNGFDPYIAAKWKLVEHSNAALVWSQAKEKYETLWYTFAIDKTLAFGPIGTYTYLDWDPSGIFRNWDQAVSDDSEMQVLWLHNRHNFCSIVWVCDLLDINLIYFQKMLSEFGWLPHRMQNLGTYHDITWINDAIATTPEATIAAITTFGNAVDTLFYGGIEWDYDHSWVVDLIIKHDITNLILFPDSWCHILEWLNIKNEDISRYHILETRDMAAWVEFAKTYTTTWKTALLSCWSPSFSCWSGYVEKGELFANNISELINK